MPSTSLPHLRAELAEKSQPKLAKCVPPTRREASEERVARAFRSAIDALAWSQRETARHLGLCERLIRDYLAGARQLPAWVPMALPRDGQVAFLIALTEEVPARGEDEEARCA